MKFRKLLTEGEIVQDFEVIAYRYIYPLGYYSDNSIEEFDDKLYNGEDISKEINDLDRKIRDYQRLGERIIEIRKNPEIAQDNEKDALRYGINEKDFRKQLDKAKKILEMYINKNIAIQDIMTCVKPGESAKTAVKKLCKMTKTAKWINGENFKAYDFFDEYTPEDIFAQIEKFNGTVKLNGAIDTYIQFENGKVESVYF